MDEGMKRQGYTYADCQKDLAKREDGLIKDIEQFESQGLSGDFRYDGDSYSQPKFDEKKKAQEGRKDALLQVQTLRYNLIVAQFDRFNLSRVTPGKVSHYLSCGTNLRNGKSESEWAMMAALNGEIRAGLLDGAKGNKEAEAELERRMREMDIDLPEAFEKRPTPSVASPRRETSGRLRGSRKASEKKAGEYEEEEKKWKGKPTYGREENDGACCVCQERKADVTIRPCGHEQMCGVCVGQVDMCPICRGPIEHVSKY